MVAVPLGKGSRACGLVESADEGRTYAPDRYIACTEYLGTSQRSEAGLGSPGLGTTQGYPAQEAVVDQSIR